jgi:dolichol-phosphate mannosyltransferase
MANKKLVSLVLPVYNEQENLEPFYKEISKISEKAEDYTFEYIFINDGSKDKSIDILKRISQKDDRARIIDFSRNFGHQMALTAGYDHARGDYIISMDTDLQDTPLLILEMLGKAEEGFDIVYARRSSRHDGFFKRKTAEFYYKLMEKFSNFTLPRNVGDFRLINKKVLQYLNDCREKSRYMRGLVGWLGFNYSFVEFDRPNRLHGETNYPISKMLKLAFDGLTGFTDLPLQISKYLGVISLIVGNFGLLLMFLIQVLGINVFPTWAYLIVILFIYSGFQFIVLWFLGEYIGRIYEDGKRRPLYIVKEKINLN